VQILAMLTMLIDHIGLMFFPQEAIWRIIGRISFPLYVYALVLGQIHTRSKRRYALRLLFIALISQVPYQLAIGVLRPNVVFTLLAGLLLIELTERWMKRFPVLVTVCLAASCIAAELLNLDYGAYGILLILIFKFAPLLPAAFSAETPSPGITASVSSTAPAISTGGTALVVCHFMLNLAFLYWNSILQLFSLVPTLLIVYAPTFWAAIERIHLSNRWIWRSFYPAHLALLFLIKSLLL
jgi:hypothetical protein